MYNINVCQIKRNMHICFIFEQAKHLIRLNLFYQLTMKISSLNIEQTSPFY